MLDEFDTSAGASRVRETINRGTRDVYDLPELDQTRSMLGYPSRRHEHGLSTLDKEVCLGSLIKSLSTERFKKPFRCCLDRDLQPDDVDFPHYREPTFFKLVLYHPIVDN